MDPFQARFPKIRAWIFRLVYLPVAVYCVVLGWSALLAHFSTDDPMNMGWAWRDGFWLLLRENITFWSTGYRPMGQLYYLSIYRLFGLHPLPYRIVILSLVVLNAYLSCRLAERLTGSRAIGFLTGIFTAAHPSMVDLYYQNDIIYDVLAYFFSMLVMLRYASIRLRGDLPNLRQAAGIVCLFLTALNSKEIAAPLAGFILAYEWLFHGGPSGLGTAVAWMKREGRLPLVLVLLAGVYTAGKLLGRNSLVSIESYTVHLSYNLYLRNNRAFLGSLFRLYSITRNAQLYGINAMLLLILGTCKKNPALRWSCFYVLTAALPVAFIRERGGTALYLPWFGWCLLLSIVAVGLIEKVAPAFTWSRFQVPAPAVQAGLVAILAYAHVSETLYWWDGQPIGHLTGQQQTWSVISRMQALPFRPKPHSSVLFLSDPFDDWRTVFISQLVWDDHSVEIIFAHRLPSKLTQAEMDRFGSILTFEGDTPKVVRR